MRPHVLTAAAAVILIGLAVDFHESVAQAGFLRNGVRPGAVAKVPFLRPPPAGNGVRIRQPGAMLREAPAATPPRTRATRHEWFWATLSPAATLAAPGRWGAALAAVQARRDKGQGLFPVDRLRGIRAAWGPAIEAAARKHRLSQLVLMAVMAVESGGKQRALSPKGAQGLMQLIPATAARFGVTDAYDPAANIAGGAAYLDWLLGEFDGDIVLALAGYNAGEGAVHRHKGVPPYAETRDYVVLVLDALAAALTLCDEPPDGPRTPCRWVPEI